MNIEHGQNEEQAATHIRCDLLSNAVNITTAIDKVRDFYNNSHVSSIKDTLLKIIEVFTCFLIARQDGID